MKRFFTLIAGGLFCASVAMASDGKQLYENFRCTGCHGTDGKGMGASFRVTKPIAGIQSDVTSESIMKMMGGASKAHIPGSCDASPTKEQAKAIADYVASLPQ